jgi:predicted transcriptional regulator
MQTLIDIPSTEVERLDEICRRQRLSREEALRQAVAEYVDRHQQLSADEAFGLWRDRGEDGLAYQQRLRAEWAA